MDNFDRVRFVLNEAVAIIQSRNQIVTTIHIALGELSELDSGSFQTQWRERSKGTLAEHAQLHFRLVLAEVQCMACFRKYQPIDKQISCPYCGSFGAKILAGEECHLESINAEYE